MHTHFGTLLEFIFYPLFESKIGEWLADCLLRLGPRQCVTFLPESFYRELYSALICGTSIPPSAEKQVIVDTGLIHLMVVSGWHLVFLEILLGFLSRPPRLVILVAYGWLTGFAPPVVRALLRRILRPILSERFGFTRLQGEAAFTGLLLILIPSWLLSRSFLMSWMGGLAMCTPQILKSRVWDRSIKAYLYMIPFCWASPIQLLWNVFFAPAVGLILFPSCSIAMLIHRLSFLTDWIWNLFLRVISLGPQSIPAAIFISSVQLCWLPPLFHMLLMIGEVSWRRKSAFSSSLA